MLRKSTRWSAQRTEAPGMRTPLLAFVSISSGFKSNPPRSFNRNGARVNPHQRQTSRPAMGEVFRGTPKSFLLPCLARGIKRDPGTKGSLNWRSHCLGNPVENQTRERPAGQRIAHHTTQPGRTSRIESLRAGSRPRPWAGAARTHSASLDHIRVAWWHRS